MLPINDRPRVLVTGASGFIGSALVLALQERGYRVLALSHIASDPARDLYQWDPEGGIIPQDPLEHLEGVFHLAGSPIASLPWNSSTKQLIVSSRVQSSRVLTRALLQCDVPPRFVCSASAVGFYGDRGDQWLTEESGKGHGFLPDVCEAWEAATVPLKDRGVRRIITRFGIVVHRRGGIAGRMLPWFRWGLGAVLGSGEQWISWISRDDLVQALCWLGFSSLLDGVVNCTAPEPVRARRWAEVLAEAVHRPLLIRVPSWIVRGVLGEAGESLMLASSRVSCQRLLSAGFQYRDATLTPQVLA